jgi:DNA polymerase-1
VIGANLSKEPKWVDALLKDSDLHAITAMAAFKLSQEAWDALPADEKKRKRGIGKILNFATLYGATAHTLSRNTGLPIPVAEQIYNGFVKGHPQLFSWMDKVKLFARRNGYTNTYFGRRRWLKQFYNEGSNRMKAFADRSAVNTAVQGTGADVTRIAMVKADKWLRTNQVDWDQARLVLSIHDELVFLMKESLVDQVGPHLVRQMMFNVKGWAVQLSVEPKLGTVWGEGKKYKFPELLAA